MNDIQKKIERYSDLQHQFYASEGVKLYNASLAQRAACYTFQINFNELYAFVKLHFDLESEGRLGDFNHREPLHKYLIELTRRFHNFLTSATTLMENTKSFVIHYYGRQSAIYKEYQAEVRSVEANPVCQFTADLRNFFTHVEAPFIDSVMGGCEATGRDQYTLRLNTEKVCQSRKWTDGAQQYIKARKNDVDLELYIVEYYQAIVAFQEWLQEKAQLWGKPEWDRSLAIYDEVMSYWN